MSKNKYGKRYDGKLKTRICKNIDDGKMTFSEAIKKYELNSSTLCTWLRLYRTDRKIELKKGRPLGRKKGNLYKPKGYETLEKKKKLTQEEEIRFLKMKNAYYEKLIKHLTEDENGKKKFQIQ